MIVGGIAVIARGVPRLTVDIDATVWGEELSLPRLFSVLEAHDIEPRSSEHREHAQQQGVLLLRHRPTETPMEIFLAWLPFEREAIARATPVQFGDTEILTAQPADLIVYKFVAWRERDKDDIDKLLLLHGETIDLAGR